MTTWLDLAANGGGRGDGAYDPYNLPALAGLTWLLSLLQLADRAHPSPGHNRLDAASAARPPVTAQQLREDRILEEAAVTGADPPHLCAVFNITSETGLHYTRFFHPDPTDSDEVSGCNMETS
ncbi:hypothetical protein [Actinacidiphila paucisporea]|uniref:Uncharacterized protein n=1 Tax=Actinacidiphila paucisporea TaxID=310782 RepID=A0A1M7Q676_9ACTN|nr:hypothetical protein [Actinacidiphila paucisporea]SHN25973.1 hypothetical protein SAMN05216499_12969 [Actinacidiphila paucisporea]